MKNNLQNKRTSDFKRNAKLDNLISELMTFLRPLQKEIDIKFTETIWPVTFIIGVPRSGTSLALQILASTNAFSYPSNIINRFAYLPYLGSLVQQMLFNPEYDYHKQFSDIKSKINFSSNLGISQGALATNEFQNFFRNHIPKQEDGYIDNDNLKKVNINKIVSGMASIESVFNKPFITKGVLIQNNLRFFQDKIPKSIYVVVKRPPIMTMQSLLLSRIKYTGDRYTWWSLRPKEFRGLAKMDPYEQIAGQVYYLDRAIKKGLCDIDKHRRIIIRYEDICKKPSNLYEILKEKYLKLGYQLEWPKLNIIHKFMVKEENLLSTCEINKLSLAYEKFENMEKGGLFTNEEGKS